MKNFSELEKKIGINFKNKDFLIQAFVHRSYLNENPKFYLGHNERMEFLGDAVLELVITEYLYEKYPKKSEGELTSWRAALVNAKILSQVAEKLDMNNFLLLSRGEEKDLGKARRYILANTFEALIGAIYLDQGYKSCQNFIKKHLIIKLSYIIKTKLFKNIKGYLQEKAQEKIKITPIYKVLKEQGPDHIKYFTVGVFFDNKLIAQGEGFSKQEAEEKAAQKALEIKKW